MLGDQSRADRIEGEDVRHPRRVDHPPGFFGAMAVVCMQDACCDNDQINRTLGRYGAGSNCNAWLVRQVETEIASLGTHSSQHGCKIPRSAKLGCDCRPNAPGRAENDCSLPAHWPRQASHAAIARARAASWPIIGKG